MMNRILHNTILYRILQWTWGFPQTLAGAVLYLALRRRPHASYMGARVTEWPFETSLSLGMFLFLSESIGSKYRTFEERLHNERRTSRLLVHEYGHSIQSLMMGPIFLLAVGLPSVIWNQLPVCEQKRIAKNISYYSVYPENHANRLGEKYLQKQAAGSNTRFETE